MKASNLSQKRPNTASSECGNTTVYHKQTSGRLTSCTIVRCGTGRVLVKNLWKIFKTYVRW